MTQGAYQHPPGGPDDREQAGTVAPPDRALVELVHLLSHDLRGPLTLVIGALQTLIRTDALPSDASLRGLVEAAYDGSHRMRETLDDFIAAADVAAGDTVLERREIEPAETLRRAVGRDADIASTTVVRGSDLPRVSLDPDQLARAVVGLIRATARRGAVRTTVDVAVGTEQVVVVVASDAPAGRLRGPGSSTGAPGLSERLAGSIVAAMGGELASVPIPGGGSGYRMVLPREGPSGEASVGAGSA